MMFLFLYWVIAFCQMSCCDIEELCEVGLSLLCLWFELDYWLC